MVTWVSWGGLPCLLRSGKNCKKTRVTKKELHYKTNGEKSLITNLSKKLSRAELTIERKPVFMSVCVPTSLSKEGTSMWIFDFMTWVPPTYSSGLLYHNLLQLAMSSFVFSDNYDLGLRLMAPNFLVWILPLALMALSHFLWRRPIGGRRGRERGVRTPVLDMR